MTTYKQSDTPLATMCRLRGIPPLRVETILEGAGLSTSRWRIYKLFSGRAKLRPLEAAALAAVLKCGTNDIEAPPTRNVKS